MGYELIKMRRFLYWIPAVIHAGILFSLSHMSSPPGAEMAPDYVAHFLAYGFFAWTLIWALTDGFSKALTGSRLGTVFLIAFLYALSDEFHQMFVPGRYASLQDIGADSAGAFLFGLAGFLGLRWNAKRNAGDEA